jgi:hypothetical protein
VLPSQAFTGSSLEQTYTGFSSNNRGSPALAHEPGTSLATRIHRQAPFMGNGDRTL